MVTRIFLFNKILLVLLVGKGENITHEVSWYQNLSKLEKKLKKKDWAASNSRAKIKKYVQVCILVQFQGKSVQRDQAVILRKPSR